MMCSAYKLNKQGDNIQLWHTPSPIWNQCVVPCPVLTVASWPAYRFLKRQTGIPIELFQTLKDDAVKVLHSICQQIWKTYQWPQDWKRSVFVPIPKKGNAKECSNDRTIALISHASKVMLKILQARLQQYMNHKLPDVQAGLRKRRGTRDQIANIHWVIEKAREFQKNIYLCFMTTPKPLTVWITTNYGKFLKRWECQTIWPASSETYMQIKK